MPNPSSRRKPGRLVRTKQRLPDKLTEKASVPEIRAYILRLQKFLDWLTANQDDLNRYEWFRYDSLPGKHGATHLGGDDNIISQDTPTPIALGAEGDRGTPQGGAAAGDHVHAFNFSPGEIDPDLISGSPNPPFQTLTQQLEWHNAQAVREYMYRPWAANTWI